MADIHKEEENPTPLRILGFGGASSSKAVEDDASVDHPMSEGGPQAEETMAAQEQREESKNGSEEEEVGENSGEEENAGEEMRMGEGKGGRKEVVSRSFKEFGGLGMAGGGRIWRAAMAEFQDDFRS